MTDNPTEATGHPAAQIALSADLTEQLGRSAGDYAEALWSVAQQGDADADEMAASIRAVNQRFGVDSPDVVIDRWQEIFRNSGGFLTIISEEHVLAGALSDTDALEDPHASTNPSVDQ
ncbi:hypothetical protein GCM10011492_27400 [Flexivirga endophytica]|uniref:Uncharacterized protein n=1 Tax=Flexivirga endophytica TaxID=1849103 RepID=A0A916T847_9MICO|nr:hypothetical protein [Flexivirga endophytica]GGB35249.1 hypothetical protein GCM10011492_27400 [Flexivirga endophytica]GHB43056.1 hypothetical protein GCM10008112_09780 [Flexivirga endophytica]